jgi:hypothetical protein
MECVIEDWIHLADTGTCGGPFEHGNELSGFMAGREGGVEKARPVKAALHWLRLQIF